MNEQESAMIPYFAHEGEMNRAERANVRLWIIIIILIVVLVGTNVGWIYYENQFTDEITTITQESEEGTNNFIGEDGVIVNK